MSYAHLIDGADESEVRNFDTQLVSVLPVSTGTDELLALLRSQKGRR